MLVRLTAKSEYWDMPYFLKVEMRPKHLDRTIQKHTIYQN